MKFTQRSALLSLLCITAACTTTEAPADPQRDPVKDLSYLHRGPTGQIDDVARNQDPTTLQMLQDKSEELIKTKKRLEEATDDLARRESEAVKLRELAAQAKSEIDGLHTLLNEASARERAATEAALTAEVARLRLEQELLKTKLGDLVKDH